MHFMSTQIVFVPVWGSILVPENAEETSLLINWVGCPWNRSEMSLKNRSERDRGGTFSVTLRWGRCHNILKGFGLSNIHSIIYFVHHKLSLPNVGISNWKRTLREIWNSILWSIFEEQSLINIWEEHTLSGKVSVWDFAKVWERTNVDSRFSPSFPVSLINICKKHTVWFCC